MTLSDLIKTTEGAVVLGGLLATVLFGKVFAIATAIGYLLINLPSLWRTVKGWFS